MLEALFTLLNNFFHLTAACPNNSFGDIEFFVFLDLDLISAGEFPLMGLDVLFVLGVVGRIFAF
jgi:hypothetical protein